MTSSSSTVDLNHQESSNGFRDRLYGNYTDTVGSRPTWSLSRTLWQFEQVWREFLPADKQTPILDVGCGGGQFLLYLKNKGFSALYGVDTSADQVAIARNLGLTTVAFGQAEEYVSRYKSYFGIINVQNILEHLNRDELLRMLDLIHDALHENGRIWIVVPNGLSPWGVAVRYDDLTHETCFTPQSLSQALVTCGFTDIEFREVRPLVHGLKSFVRLALWKCIRSFIHLWRMVEFGGPSVASVYTHDMQVVARKAQKKSR